MAMDIDIDYDLRWHDTGTGTCWYITSLWLCHGAGYREIRR